MQTEAKYKTLSQITQGLDMSGSDPVMMERMLIKYEPGLDPPLYQNHVILPRFVVFNHGDWNEFGSRTEYDLLVPEECRQFLMQFNKKDPLIK